MREKNGEYMDKIKCAICGRELSNYKGLGSHIRQSHNIDSKSYYIEYLGDEGKCLHCGKPTKFRSINEGFKKFCSKKCVANSEYTREKSKATNLKRYGVENGAQAEEIKAKIAKTNLEHYGTENVFASKEIKEKIKETNLERYGVENAAQSEKIKSKTRETNLERYGGNAPIHSEDVKAKIANTNIERYGAENVFYSDAIREKIKQTNLERYGAENVYASKEIQSRIAKTNLERYGAENVFASDEIKEKITQTMVEKYDVEHPLQHKDIFHKAYNTMRENNYLSGSEIRFENALKEHGVNYKYQYKEKRYPYFCDFYIPEKDLFIELHIYFMHGGHWFNPYSNKDLDTINLWLSKPNIQYKKAIRCFTKGDVERRNIARKNNLNYVVFWKEEDIDLWFSLGCPTGKDWIREYTWVKGEMK